VNDNRNQNRIHIIPKESEMLEELDISYRGSFKATEYSAGCVTPNYLGQRLIIIIIIIISVTNEVLRNKNIEHRDR
jgi:hypothetical protein